MPSGSLLDDACAILLDEHLSQVVDFVAFARDGLIEAHAHAGAVAFDRDGVVRWSRGSNPLERQDPGAFGSLAEELANLRPSNDRNHYPYAYDNLAQLFRSSLAPDLVVVHTPAHNWEEKGGHRGEHGSLDVVQSRAPLILSGAGIAKRGRIPSAARMIDIAPTLAHLAGVHSRDGGTMRGRVLAEALDPTTSPSRVVAFLCDGTNANVLYALADAGELPAVARLMREGTTFGHGCMSSFPSVTLANHTTALTGVHPGDHGVLHNFYFDRVRGRRIVTNSPDVWHLARDEIRGDVETVFEAIARSSGAFTAAVNEPVDRGATYSTFDLVRAASLGAMQSALPDPAAIPGVTSPFGERKREYGWASAADHLAVEQVRRVWSGDNGDAPPRFTWVNLILPDAANHAGGPYSDIGHAGLRDTDKRLGSILDAIGWDNGDTAFVLLADHGMEESDPDCTGDWDDALERAGIPFRDEGYGFIYLAP